MDPDMNKYDLNHRVSHHPEMSDEEWEEAYRAAWENFYTPEHIRTILRRAAANRSAGRSTTLTTMLWFKLMILYEGVHPLEGGAFRLKFRRDRRHGLQREKPVRVLSALCRRDVREGVALLAVYRKRNAHARGRCCARRTAGPTAISPSRRRGTTSSRRWTSTTPPAAARRRSPASGATI